MRSNASALEELRHERVAAQSARKVASRALARQPHASGRDDFVVYEVQPDDLWPTGFVEVAVHGVADRRAERVEIVRLGDVRRANAARGVAAFGGVGDEKQDLGHGRLRGGQRSNAS